MLFKEIVDGRTDAYITALWCQIIINDCPQQLIFSNTSKSFSICVLIVLFRVSRSKYILFGKVCGKELSFGLRWIQKGINVYLYFMIFCNINNVCNNCHFISVSDLRSSVNEIDSAGRLNSWRGETTHFEKARFWRYKTMNKTNLNVLYHIVYLYCACFILGHVRQDFIEIVEF